MQTSPVNDTLVRVVGMSRSGNHAIIEWMLSGLPGRWCFLNCVEPKRDPWQTARPMDDGQRCLTSGSLAKPLRGSGWDCLVLSHEDTFLRPVFGEAGTAIQEAAVGGAQRRIDVLVLRDPYNLFASRWRGGMGWVTDHIALRIWKQHAKAFMAERWAPGHALVPISYNAWVADAAYRRRVAGRLGIAPLWETPPRVSRCGGGSSFDGYAHATPPHRMLVFDRWRHYAGDPQYAALFDTEVRRLAQAIFGNAVSEPAMLVDRDHASRQAVAADAPSVSGHGYPREGRTERRPTGCAPASRP